VEPDLVGLTDRLAKALKPYQMKYFRELAQADGKPTPAGATFLSTGRATAQKVWTTFRQAMENALDDKSLHLDTTHPTREDGSVFISVSSYRDPTCSNTVKSVFERADNPNLVNVGIVQQNCESEHGCFWGDGWANTRRWHPRDGKDPDCVMDFCASEAGKPHCDAGRVRILRLSEHQAYGPLFSRYLNSKLWRGENYFMQIDAHSNFRQGWDTTAIEMLKRTPSYPNSVLSAYPAQGMAASNSEWSRARGLSEGRVQGLCGLSFEQVNGRTTMRLQPTTIHSDKAQKTGVAPYSAFVAAGFFFTHGSYVDKVPADPFMPYIFMGEEMELSIRMWTNGFDIYAPTVNVIRHEYERHDSPKFWETVNMVFNDGAMHNAVSALILQRVQNLVDFPEAHSANQVHPFDVIARMDQFGIGENRSREMFLNTMGVDVENKRQRVPKWCSQGSTPNEL